MQVPQALDLAGSDGAEVPLMGTAQDTALQRTLTVRCRLRQQGACAAKDVCISAAVPHGLQLDEVSRWQRAALNTGCTMAACVADSLGALPSTASSLMGCIAGTQAVA